MPMCVLHVFDHSLPVQSGYSFRSLAILREQRNLGLETIQVTSSKHPIALGDEEQEGFHFHRTAPGSLASISVLDQYDVIRRLEVRVRGLLARQRIDVVHAHSPCLTGIAALRASRAFDLPFVYEMRALWEDAAVEHGTTKANSLRYRAARTLETWTLRRADAVVCICEGLKREVVGRGLERERVTVVPNAVDLDQFHLLESRDTEIVARLGLGVKSVIGYIGSLYGYEGVDLLIKAMALMRENQPELMLLIVGGGPEEERLKIRIRELGLQDRALVVGAVPHAEIARYYSVVDVLIYPRRQTRLTELVTPLKPLEAMAQGKIVLASDIGGHRELIGQSENGILFPANDPEAIVATVAQMLDNRSSWREIAATARAYVERERSWRDNVARYLGIYDAAIERHGRVHRATN